VSKIVLSFTANDDGFFRSGFFAPDVDTVATDEERLMLLGTWLLRFMSQ
jgi:hypothetical protein